MKKLGHKLLSQQAFIITSYVMIFLSIIGMIINCTLYLLKVIDSQMLIFVTLILSWLALTFAAYGNVISAQVNKKLEESNNK